MGEINEKYDPKTEKKIDRVGPEAQRRYLENYGVKCIGVEKGYESTFEVGKYYVIQKDGQTTNANVLPEIGPMLDVEEQPITFMEIATSMLDNYWGGPAQVMSVKVDLLDKAKFKAEEKTEANTCRLLSIYDALSFPENYQKVYLILRHEANKEEFKILEEQSQVSGATGLQPLLVSKVQETLGIAPSVLKKCSTLVKIDHGFFDLSEFLFWQVGDEYAYEELMAEDETDEEMELISAPLGKYDEFRVGEEGVSIKAFVLKQGLEFKVGKGYYQFTKPEQISKGKRILLKQKQTGEIYEGETARKIAGIPENAGGKIDPADLPDYEVFVQSTSSTRILQSGTLFIYEADTKGETSKEDDDED